MKTLVRRIWDALRGFYAGLSGSLELPSTKPTSQVRALAEINAAMIEVASVLEKMNMWAARVAKREAREAKRSLEVDGVPDAAPPPPMTVKERKAALRQVVRARQLGIPLDLPLAPPALSPSNNGDEEDEP